VLELVVVVLDEVVVVVPSLLVVVSVDVSVVISISVMVSTMMISTSIVMVMLVNPGMQPHLKLPKDAALVRTAAAWN
jgi:hypothetical protein